MAQVSFIISAVDKTRAAFASINQGLNKMAKGGDATQKKLFTMGLQAIGVASIFKLLGTQVRKVAQDIESVPGVSRDVIDSWDQLKSAASAANGVLGSVVANAGHAIASAGRLAEFAWNALVRGVDEAQRKVLETDRAMATLRDQGDVDKLTSAIERLGKARRDLANVGETAGASITRRREEANLMERTAVAMSDNVKRTEKLAAATELRSAAERDANKLLAENNKLIDASDVAHRNLSGRLVPLKDRIAGLSKEYANLTREIHANKSRNDPKRVEELNGLLEKRTAVVIETTKAYDEQNRIAANAAQIISGGFEDAIFAGEGLRGVIRGIGQDLLRYVFQETITSSVGGFLTGGIKSLLGFKAAGGPISAGAPYIVGENGPELFTPSQAGRIIPNHALASGGGGGGNTYNIDARGTDESVVSRLSAALMQLAGPGVVERRALTATGDSRARRASAFAG